MLLYSLLSSFFLIGIVRGVKKETEELFLLTPLNEDMLSQVNSIIKGCVYLPNTIFCNPPESVTGHVPYTSVSNNVLSGVVKKTYKNLDTV